MSKLITKSEAERFSNIELVDHHLFEESSRHVTGPIIKDRMLRAGVKHVLHLQQAPALEPSTEVQTPASDSAKFPWQDEEWVSSWMHRYQPWQLAEEALKNGFNGEGMTNHEEAVDWMHTAIRAKTEWCDLHAPAVRFWKAFQSKYSRFATKQGVR